MEKIPNLESVYETFCGLVQNIRNFDMDNKLGIIQLKQYETLDCSTKPAIFFHKVVQTFLQFREPAMVPWTYYETLMRTRKCR